MEDVNVPLRCRRWRRMLLIDWMLRVEDGEGVLEEELDR